jgi:MYXO-CTERM domain-containing protein
LKYVASLLLLFTIAFSPRAHAMPEVSCSAYVLDGYDDTWQPCCTGTAEGLSPPVPVTVVTVDGVSVQVDTANAFIAMANAAASDPVNPVTLELASGMRTMKKQMQHWQCFLCTKSSYYKMCAEDLATKPPAKSCGNCTYDVGDGPKACGSCNLAACPGTSNHQMGIALDISTGCAQFDKTIAIQPQVDACIAKSNTFKWLMAHANSFGFYRTVTVEPWHWDYLIPGPWAGPCEGGVASEDSCEAAPVAGAEDSLFKDLPPGAFGQEEAELCYAAGITNGCQEDYFCPDCNVTRAMAVTLLIRAAQIPVDENASPSFEDLSPGAYYVPYVEKAKELGITIGCDPPTKFCPDVPVTRKEFAKFLVESLGIPTVNPPNGSFDDVAKDWGYPYIETLKEYCITTGCEDGTVFCPSGLVDRAMAVVFIARAWDLADMNDCISYCDEDSCTGADYCEEWGECSFASTCAESGIRARKCHGFECTGAMTSASCAQSTVDEEVLCEQDTDGDVVEAWGPWSVCEPTAKCAGTGTRSKVRIICSNGSEMEDTKVEDCTPIDDLDCNSGEEPDTIENPGSDASDASDAGAGSDGQNDMNTVGESADGSVPMPGGDAVVLSPADTEVVVGSSKSSGCSGSSSPPLLPWLVIGLGLLAGWQRRRRCS